MFGKILEPKNAMSELMEIDETVPAIKSPSVAGDEFFDAEDNGKR